MSPSDGILLDEWRRGRHPDVLAEILARFGPLVYAACLRILENSSEAENVARESLEALLTSRTIEGPPAAWLHRDATVRSLARREHRPGSAKRPDAASTVQADWERVRPLLDEAVNGLPDRLRAPIVGHTLEGKSYADVASEIGSTRQRVMYDVGKGQERLRKALKKRGLVLSPQTLRTVLSGLLEHTPLVPASLTSSLSPLAAENAPPVSDLLEKETPVRKGRGINRYGVAAAVGIALFILLGVGFLCWITAAPQEETAKTAAAVAAQDMPSPIDSSMPTPDKTERPSAVSESGAETQAKEGHVSPAAAVDTTAAADGDESGKADSATILGRVLRADAQQPVSTFSAGYVPGVPSPDSPEELENTRLTPFTDRAGRFQLNGVPPGDATIIVRAPGFATGTAVVRGLVANTTRPNVIVMLERGGIVEGKVQNRSGEPVPGAMIFDRPVPIDAMPNATPAAWSGPLGEFRIDTLPPGRRTLVAYHPASAPAYADVLIQPPKTERTVLVLTEGGSIEGHVTQHGVPVSGTAVTLEYGPGGGATGALHTITGAEGAYRFDHLPAGEARVSVRLEQDSSGMQSESLDRLAEIQDGEVTVVDFDLEAGSGIEGQVLLDGVPLAQTAVYITVETLDGAVQEFSTQTDFSGNYAFEAIPPGMAAVRVLRQHAEDAWNAAIRRVDVAPEEVVRCDVHLTSQGATLDGQLVGIGPGESAYVAILQGELNIQAPAYDAIAQISAVKVAEPEVRFDGTFYVEGLEPGAYTVFAMAMPAGRSEAEALRDARTVCQTIQAPASGHITVDVALP